jgi:hypothetical protein
MTFRSPALAAITNLGYGNGKAFPDVVVNTAERYVHLQIDGKLPTCPNRAGSQRVAQWVNV